jgi:hypothetical protein
MLSLIEHSLETFGTLKTKNYELLFKQNQRFVADVVSGLWAIADCTIAGLQQQNICAHWNIPGH